MPVVKTPGNSRLSLILQVGVQANGQPKELNRGFGRIRPEATDEDIHAVAIGLKGLQTRTLLRVERTDLATLSES